MDDSILIEARGLRKVFPLRDGVLKRQVGSVRAVDGVDLLVRRGGTTGLVGESGCGKTTLARCLLHLLPPTAGHVYLNMPGEVRRQLIELEAEQTDVPGRKDIAAEVEAINDRYSLGSMTARRLREKRREMQMVFQDPYSSLNPRMLVRDIVGEPLAVHREARGEELDRRVRELMAMVGLTEEQRYRYPHELSGGQRQRVGIARALALRPELVVLDEPTSALDVSVQAQVLNLLKDLQSDLSLSYLLISHDLSAVRHMCDYVHVMYLGKIVEAAPSWQLFEGPLHPYTQALMSAVPVPDPGRRHRHAPLPGEMPSPADPPRGCRFHPRCPCRQARCEEEEPPLVEVRKDHLLACHLHR